MENKIRKILEVWGKMLVEDMRRAIHQVVTKGGGSATDLEGSVRFEIVRTFEGLQFQLLMNEYWVYVDGGRGKTKNGGNGAVQKAVGKDWQASQGISPSQIIYDLTVEYNRKKGLKRTVKKLPFAKAAKQLGYLISRKIHKEGIKPRPFYDKVINESRINQLQDMLAPVISDEISLLFQ